jgi:hypothetical protein
MVGLVIARARHTAKIGSKKGYFTRYPVLKDASSLKTVCARTVRLSVPVIYFHITTWFGGELAVIIAHLCSEMAVLGRNTIRFFQRSIRYSSSKHAVHSYLTAFLLYGRNITANFWGHFYNGEYLPQKSTPKSSIETE